MAYDLWSQKEIDARMHVAFVTLQLPHIATKPGQYVTRSGETITIDRVTTHGSRVTCHGKYESGIEDRWDASGRIWHNRECQNDLVRMI
jgi:hypothetical protein